MMRFKNFVRGPTALQVAVRELEDAGLERLAQTKLREYHAAMEQMLLARIARLRHDIQDLPKELT